MTRLSHAEPGVSSVRRREGFDGIGVAMMNATMKTLHGARPVVRSHYVPMSAFAKLSEIAPLPIWDGVVSRAVQGAHITMAIVELEPNSVVPEHQHHNEQLGLVLKGSLDFTIGGEHCRVTAGDTYNIPAQVPHGVTTGPDGAVVLDVFSPVRADWARFTADAPRTPAWP
jgi:quercetin dioxygenase-like cupin family protein